MRHLKGYQQFSILELNTSDSYFTKDADIKKKLDDEFKKLIDSISEKLKIELPIESWCDEFLLIKKELMIDIKKNNLICDYFEEYGQDKKMIEKVLLKHCSNKEISKKVFTNKKLNITHLDFKLVDNVDNIETYQVIFPEDIRNHILTNYSTNKLDYLIYINCESNNFNRLHFPGRIERWYRSNDKRFGKDEQPQPYIGKHGKYIHDMFDGIPESLRGTGLGYAIYKEFIKFKGYVSSNSWSSTLSQSVWKKLAGDTDLYGILVNYKGQDGDTLLFSKSYQGDCKKVCEEFLSKAKQGKLYRGEASNFEITNIEISDELKELLPKSN